MFSVQSRAQDPMSVRDRLRSPTVEEAVQREGCIRAEIRQELREHTRYASTMSSG